MKNFLTALLLLLASNVYAQNSVVVIPMFDDVIVEVEVEICTGFDIGDEIFVLSESSTTLRVGDVYSTTDELLVSITGLHNPSWSGTTRWISYRGESFLVAPISLPEPIAGDGVKGPFYFMVNGGIAYAKYL